MTSDLLEIKRMLSRRYLLGGETGSATGAASWSAAAARASENSGVHAVGIGRKMAGGRLDGVTAVKLYVDRKQPAAKLDTGMRLPAEIDGIPTDVIESPRAVLSASQPCSVQRQAHLRPLIAGTSIGHAGNIAGTLAYFCRSTRPTDDPQRIYVLSNKHVLSPINSGRPGSAVFQPGSLDGGTGPDKIAELSRYVPLNLSGGMSHIDAAIAELLDDIEWRPELCSIGAISGTMIGTDTMPVRLHGRTTGYTEGQITDESLDAQVQIPSGTKTCVTLFENQLRIEPSTGYDAIAPQGNSGSLIVDRDSPAAIALLFAGGGESGRDGTYGLAHPIDQVLTTLEIALV
ncbi:hypothetical protein [Methylobacterium oryzisoli]|uniref:hypothetical protein n=1 Tax=Methylobacterium oryzisoli TaxID=3385502 RepID=UPI003891C113